MARLLKWLLPLFVLTAVAPAVGEEPLSPDRAAKFEEYRRLQTEARAARTRGDYADAIAAAESALNIERDLMGDAYPGLIAIVRFLADCEEQRENWEAAEARQTEVLNRALKAHGERNYRIVDARLALEHLSRLRSMSAMERESFREATALNSQIVELFRKAEYREAEKLALRALQQREKLLGPDDPLTSMSLHNLALSYKAQGNYAAAEPLYQRALGICEKALGPDHPDTATALSNLAELYAKEGSYAAAEPLYQRAVKIKENTLGPNHPDTAICLNNLAVFYKSQANYVAAEPLYRRALKIQELVLGADHPSTSASLHNLAAVYKSLGDYATAERLYQRALEIREKALGPDHPETAATLNSLGLLYDSQGNDAAAEPLHRRALQICEKALGADHPSTAGSLNNLAGSCKSQGDFAAAETLYKRALKIAEKTLGPEHPNTATCLNNLGGLYDAQGNYAAAEPLYRRALQCTFRHLDRTALVQTEQQQLGMRRMLRHRINTYLSCLTRLPDREQLAFAAVLGWKGATLLRQRSMRLIADEPAIATLFQDLQDVTRQWASLATATLPTDENAAKAFRVHLADVQHEKERLEVELSKRSAVYRQAAQSLSVEELQKCLPPRSVLVDFLEYSHYTAGVKNDTEQWLLAFTVSAEGEVRWHQLGAVAPLIQKIGIWRRSFGTSTASQRAGQELRAALWEPLLGDIEHADLVLISPDGVLGRLPFAALPGREPGRYLLEDHRMAVVPVPQLIPLLVRNQQRKPRQHELLLLGDVDYDASASDESPADEAETPPQLLASSRSVREVNGIVKWSRLAATGAEVTAIRNLYNRQFGSEADKLVELRGARATEMAFRTLAPKTKLLHLATHGYFAPPNKQSALRDQTPAQPKGSIDEILGEGLIAVPGYSPGLLSGLVFAGANRAPSAEGTDAPADDGYMTSDEIAMLPLDGVEFVALSACETGLGRVVGGEGLLGLQRAFQIAGAKTVVASLWKVPDQATSVLMQRFYENLWEKKMGRLDAFRAAQISMFRDQGELRTSLLRDQRSRGLKPAAGAQEGSSISPFYWAAFVISGDWR